MTANNRFIGDVIDDEREELDAYAAWDERCGWHSFNDDYPSAYADLQEAKLNTELMNERFPDKAPHVCYLYYVEYELHDNGSGEILNKQALVESDGKVEHYL